MNNTLNLADNKKFLPVGSIVLLNGGSKKLMITGFMVTGEGTQNQMYDYSGCLYPEGVISSNQTPVFNHDQIKEIFHIGYIDEEEQEFKEKLNSIINSTKMINQTDNQPTPQSTVNNDNISNNALENENIFLDI